MTKNLAASVRARLTNQARDTKRPFQEVLQYLRTRTISVPPIARALDEIREPLSQFLLPVANATLEGRHFTDRWVAAGPWHDDPTTSHPSIKRR